LSGNPTYRDLAAFGLDSNVIKCQAWVLVKSSLNNALLVFKYGFGLGFCVFGIFLFTVAYPLASGVITLGFHLGTTVITRGFVVAETDQIIIS
jgi:hypothetical protein